VTILGLDTATPATAVALLLEDGGIYEARDEAEPDTRGHHTECVLGLARTLLEQAGIEWSDVDHVAVGLGPGGYTGLRIGVATAAGLARALGASLSGVGTLRALALPVAGATALTILDARRGELFAAAYAADVELLAPCVVVPAQLATLAFEASELPLLAVGDGALAHRSLLDEAGIAVAPAGSVLHRVGASAICRLAAARALDGGASVVPMYLRLPDAEIALRGAKP
jgi:tRNA threonylcarbamoyladenosine biosynthesis protein TsaB